ncbi:hypothetical protein QBC38DRAFT_443184 [Podospora fimiseda]|uniref:ERCC4 domain-containing protein n=1 Tax=Podospora fimiseda TaxID=252190 RepID=A0AAN7GZU3_9PEZI|nr:hypothetical protein QBC38DRAFT_443184 [Podospora fimiseda]
MPSRRKRGLVISDNHTEATLDCHSTLEFSSEITFETSFPTPQQRKRPHSSSITQYTNGGSSRAARSPSRESSLGPDPFLSDDDFSLSECRKLKEHNDEPAPKKQRLAVKEPSTSKRKSSPAYVGPSSSRWHQHGFKSDLDTFNDDDEFDLTADNIALPTNDKNKENTAPRDDDDIMSSALKDKGKMTETSAARRRVLDDIDPVASSSPATKRQMNNPRSKTAGWDPISSSAPIPPGSDVIAIDDSDSEDDFPDINGFIASGGARDASVSAGSSVQKKVKAKATTSKPKTTKPKKTAEERTREKEERDAAREAEKERKRLDKERTKALMEVNKLRTDKRVTTPEMIVELPTGLRPAVRCGAEKLLQDLQVEVNTIASPVANVVRWRRKVDGIFDPVLNRYEPVPLRRDPEKYTMVILEAQEFVEMALNKTLNDHVNKMKKSIPRCHQRLSHLPNRRPRYIPPEKSSRGEPKIPSSTLIHHTNAAAETYKISVFTEHISTAPYRRQKEQNNDENAGFCMDSGQIKAGNDAKDMYIKMLQEISHVTKSVADGIASEFESVSKLVKGFEERGDKVLKGVSNSANRDGTFSDRLVGKDLSKRVARVFTGRGQDWEEEDV